MPNPLLDKHDITTPGGIQWSPASPYAREICKFERGYTQYGPPGLPPYTYQPFPARLYRASRSPQGVAQFDGVTVNDEQEQRNMESRGYVAGGHGCALEALESQETEIATLAAERTANERTMSARARMEATAADDATDDHVPMVPETPIRRGPGRPTAAEVAARKAADHG